MNALEQRRFEEQITKIRLRERMDSITRIVIVSVGVAEGITHKHVYGFLFLFGLAVHLPRVAWNDEGRDSAL